MADKDLRDAAAGLVAHLRTLYKGWDGINQFDGTPDRLVRMYDEFCWSPRRIQKELRKQFRTFEDGYDEMLVTNPIQVWTLCPHHLVPCSFKVTIGYVPNKKVLGLSKFARISEILAKRPVMQEQYSRELADVFMKKLNPKGVGISIVGLHGCMVARGVRQNSRVVTSVVKGCFEEGSTRAEFYAIVNSKNH